VKSSVTADLKKTAEYNCNVGYVLIGNSTRECKLASNTNFTGVWTHDKPICEGK